MDLSKPPEHGLTNFMDPYYNLDLSLQNLISPFLSR